MNIGLPCCSTGFPGGPIGPPIVCTAAGDGWSLRRAPAFPDNCQLTATTIRTFIAIDLNPEIRKAIGQEIKRLEQAISSGAVRWLDPMGIHLTLKFLGEMPANSVQALETILRQSLRGRPAAEAGVGGLGMFPSPSRPSVVWIGVLDVRDEVAGLQALTEAACSGLGYAPEGRRFHPHLTIGRVRRQLGSQSLAGLGSKLQSITVGSLGSLPITAVHIFRSDLHPEGARYTRLASIALGDGARQASGSIGDT
jgi:2'-5' RNA ligase